MTTHLHTYDQSTSVPLGGRTFHLLACACGTSQRIVSSEARAKDAKGEDVPAELQEPWSLSESAEP